MVTPPGLRAGGAPLDPLPHERDAMVVTPPATAVPPRPGFVEAPTVIVNEGRARPPTPAGPAGRFAEVPTVLDMREAAVATPPRPAARFADVKTVIADEAALSQASRNPTLVPDPAHAPVIVVPTAASTSRTQMLEPADLSEEGATDPYMGPAPAQGWMPPASSPTMLDPYAQASPHDPYAQPLPTPAQMIAMPSPTQAFPDQAYYAHLAAGGAPRKVPPWVLGVVFVLVLALATGITVAIARAVH
jgi:hypothetical protein